MLKVPTEIWQHIASFLPDTVLHGLLSVNRALFYLSMGIRHQELSLDVYDDSINDKLERFRERGLNIYVRKLTLRARYRTELCGENVASPSSLLESIRLLEFLQGLCIDVQGHPSGFFPDDLYDFISSVWYIIPGSRFMRLHLRGSIESLNFVAPRNHTFHLLRELSLEFSDSFPNNEPGYVTPKDALMPFINSLSSKVCKLSITCFDDAIGLWRFHEFLQEMKYFTLLESLELALSALPIDGLLQVEGGYSGLQRFFSKSTSKLTSLKLNMDAYSSHTYWSPRDLSPVWLSDAMTFCQLRLLDLNLASFGAGWVGAIGDVLSRCQNTLEELTIRSDQLRQVEQVVHIIQLLKSCSQLSVLIIYVTVQSDMLDIQFFDELSTLPSLRHFTLHWGLHLGNPWIRGHAIIFLWMLESVSYIQWKLLDIGIYCNNKPLDTNIMLAIARSIPSLRSLWGQNNMEIDDTIAYEVILSRGDLNVIASKGCRGCKVDGTYPIYYPHADDESCIHHKTFLQLST
ncbi:hypothetical protein BDQ17DRAFT_1409993 [Cyathus striatus]|nr:hypothetical protein BDQ17DRAFT_1409993 [Cyathus striatus]